MTYLPYNPPLHPSQDYRPLELTHQPEPEVDHFGQIFAFQFATSDEAFDCCQRLARKCGFNVRRRSSKVTTIYIVCSREGNVKAKKDRKRDRKSDRCNCDWRIVLFLSDMQFWEFRVGKNMVHNHHLISDELRDRLDNLKRHRRTTMIPGHLSAPNFSQKVVATPPPTASTSLLEAAQHIQSISQDIFLHEAHTVVNIGDATHPKQIQPFSYTQGGNQLPPPSDGGMVMFSDPLLNPQLINDPNLFSSAQHLLELGIYQPGMISSDQTTFAYSHLNDPTSTAGRSNH